MCVCTCMYIMYRHYIPKTLHTHIYCSVILFSFLFVFVVVLFICLFGFFKTGSPCSTHWPRTCRLALISLRYTYLYVLGAPKALGTKGICHHAWFIVVLFLSCFLLVVVVVFALEHHNQGKANSQSVKYVEFNVFWHKLEKVRCGPQMLHVWLDMTKKQCMFNVSTWN